MAKTIVGVKYKDKWTGEYDGKTYNYFCDLPVVVGDIVSAPTSKGDSIARISEVDVPDTKIDVHILPIMKTITSFADVQEA